jgi:hypothetical protein
MQSKGRYVKDAANISLFSSLRPVAARKPFNYHFGVRRYAFIQRLFILEPTCDPSPSCRSLFQTFLPLHIDQERICMHLILGH